MKINLRQVFDPLSPCTRGFVPCNPRTGTIPAVGNDALDAVVLDPFFDRTTASGAAADRYDDLMKAMQNYAKVNATLATHELSHALGVTIGSQDIDEDEPQWPPQGSFGGYPAAFKGSGDIHLSLRGYEPYGYYPGAAFNFLDSGQYSYAGAIDWRTRFTSFEIAYLLQKTFYLDDDEFPGYGCYGSDGYMEKPSQCTSVPHTPYCPGCPPLDPYPCPSVSPYYYCIDQSTIP